MIKSNSANIVQLDLTKELILTDAVEMPFTSLLLKNGRQKATSTTVSWDYEQLDSSRGLVKEGIDVVAFQESDRTTGDSNVCQILQKAVSVSDTAQAVSQEHIADLFSHETRNRIIEIKRDLEYYLVNGVKDDGTTGNARQMNGLLAFVSEDSEMDSEKTFGIEVLQDMAKVMKKAGTASQNLALLCDYNTYEVVADLFEDKTYYAGVTNEFGSPLRKLNLTYATVIPYVIPDMPTNTCLMVNMNFLKIAELRALAYSNLAKTGSSMKGFIEMENTIKVLHPDAVVGFSADVLINEEEEEEEEPTTYTLTFDVNEAGATIVVEDSDNKEIDAELDGTYIVPAGTYTYAISLDEYQTQTDEVTITDKDVTVTITLIK